MENPKSVQKSQPFRRWQLENSEAITRLLLFTAHEVIPFCSRPLGDCGGDFHWYLFNGTWSHKPGQARATNLDDSKNEITDLRTADTGDYLFVRFMTTDDSVTIL